MIEGVVIAPRRIIPDGRGKVIHMLYDDRPGSPTCGELQELFIGNDNHCLVKVPVGMWIPYDWALKHR